jgi:hypothetical protein
VSLALDLTQCQQRLAEAGRKASAEARRLRSIAPPPVYDELMLQLCAVAACATELRICLGGLRMIGELEQMPPPVTTESLELASCVPVVPMLVGFSDRGDLIDQIDESEATRARFVQSMHRAGDHTLDEEEAA